MLIRAQLLDRPSLTPHATSDGPAAVERTPTSHVHGVRRARHGRPFPRAPGPECAFGAWASGATLESRRGARSSAKSASDAAGGHLATRTGVWLDPRRAVAQWRRADAMQTAAAKSTNSAARALTRTRSGVGRGAVTARPRAPGPAVGAGSARARGFRNLRFIVDAASCDGAFAFLYELRAGRACGLVFHHPRRRGAW